MKCLLVEELFIMFMIFRVVMLLFLSIKYFFIILRVGIKDNLYVKWVFLKLFDKRVIFLLNVLIMNLK